MDSVTEFKSLRKIFVFPFTLIAQSIATVECTFCIYVERQEPLPKEYPGYSIKSSDSEKKLCVQTLKIVIVIFQ